MKNSRLHVFTAMCLAMAVFVVLSPPLAGQRRKTSGSTTTTTTTAAATTTSTGYTLVAWGELGMHCMDGKDYSVFAVLPPYNTVYAKLLKQGSDPTPVTTGVTLTYQAIADSTGSINTTSAGTSSVPSKTNFWNFVYTLVGAQPPADTGVKGYKVQSLTPQAMKYDSTKGVWEAEGIPTAPYDDKGLSKAYPMIKVIAKNSSGQIIAQTTAVLAVSDEMSCKNCHASNSNAAAKPPSGWVNYTSDLGKDVKLNILKLHDSRHVIPATMLSELSTKGYNYKSSLYDTAVNLNNPILCAACHKSNALNAVGMNTGATGVPQLTTSMHMRHASVLIPGTSTTMDNATTPASSCYQCHPGVNTKCQRGAMANVACYECHGNLSRVAVATRTGWMDEPNCQMCHQGGKSYTTTFLTTNHGPSGTQRTSTDTRFATNPNVPSAGFSLYRFSKGHGGNQCQACHGSQHAEYPTNQANDNVANINIQGYAGKLTECTSCHTTAPLTANGGPHGMHTVGQSWVSAHHDYAEGSSGRAQCAYCHGSDYRGTVLSKLLTAKTFNIGDGRTKTFTAGHQMNCYDCHNGPSGG